MDLLDDIKVDRDRIRARIGRRVGLRCGQKGALGVAQLTDMARSFQEAKGIIAAPPQTPIMASDRGASVEPPACHHIIHNPRRTPPGPICRHTQRQWGEDPGAIEELMIDTKIGVYILRRPILQGIFG